MEVQAISWTSLKLAVNVRVENPNNFTIGLQNLRYKVLIGDRKIGEGDYTDKFTLGAKASGVVSIPLKVDNQAALQVASAYLKGDVALKAHVIGTSDFSTPIGSFRIPIDETKVIVKSNS